jgi:DNA-binding response OmpR family regulator
MTIAPSCPALLIHDDDPYRQSLIVQLDQKHFSVTFVENGAEAIKALEQRAFNVILVSVDLKRKRGLDVLSYLKQRRAALNGSAIIILGDPDPELRTYASVADETLLKPVDPTYVVARAQAYCRD